ncbi:MAG: hypothetical protein GWO87_01130 [Xanthomonadaceae bacterium]|nr:hypothetical protein [Rhodospirillaceae bacterium]NIA17778.1 hypothetical protein [Xanthomonadaceae bacterium]
MKKFVLFTIIFLFFFVGIAGIAEAERDTRCAAWLSDNSTIHIDSLHVGKEYFWADFRPVDSPEGKEGLFFELCPDYRYSEKVDDNCSAWDPETQTIHISSLLVGKVYYWIDLVWRKDLKLFQLTDWCSHELEIFGYALNAVDGFGDWRENLAKTAKFSNFAMIASDGTSVREIAAGDAEKISKALGLGMNRTMVVVTDVLFIGDFDESGVFTNVRLRSDYRERLQRYSSYLHLYRGKNPWAFYVLDEPYLAAIVEGMSIGKMREMLNKAIAAIKEVFPNSKTANGIAVTRSDLEQENILGFPVPENAAEEYGFPKFDLIAVYCYWAQYKPGHPNDRLEDLKKVFQEKYLGNAKDNLLPGQKIILVPGTFHFLGQEISPEDYLDLANFYWNIAKTDPQVVGIVPFLWPSSENLIGLKDLPKNVRDVWREMGKKIKNY